MKFSRQYTKLQDRLFTTIRDHSFYNEGQIIECRTPMGMIKARVLLKVPRRFNQIPEAFLQYDTDSPERSAEQIRDDIRDLYRHDAPENQDLMTVYLLERLTEAK
jgi:hypothetical protein